MDWNYDSYLQDYSRASAIEWIQSDGVGGVSSSSILNVNTRKQHALLSVLGDDGTRMDLVANLQDSLLDNGHTLDLATNMYVGALHPTGYQALVSFRSEPWPTWRYQFDECSVKKQVVTIHGEHAVIVSYTLEASHPMTLVLRPLLAFRGSNTVKRERQIHPENWHASHEFIECRPFESLPTLFIAHPNAKVHTVNLWYRQFLYERDRESGVDAIEDLFHPGYLELILKPGVQVDLIFSAPSPRTTDTAQEYLTVEQARRDALRHVEGLEADPFFERLAQAADLFVYERFDGVVDIHAGLPWGECNRYRGLIAMPGLLLATRRFELAREYLKGMARDWRQAPSPVQFAPETDFGQMHPADVPLWGFIAAWRYWRATKDISFVTEMLLPLLEEMASAYWDATDVKCVDGCLIEIGHEPGANYEPILPLGTNALWYNALMILATLHKEVGGISKSPWGKRAENAKTAFLGRFPCSRRAGFADGVWSTSGRRDETLRVSQVLVAGLPFCLAADPVPVVKLLMTELATPVGLRTLSLRDSRYVADGADLRVLPKRWSGSVDPTWLGCYCDALRVARIPLDLSQFVLFNADFPQRGIGCVSGAFSGSAPHTACDYVASASGHGEIMRIYAREILHASEI